MQNRVLVVFEPGRAGAAALEAARELILGEGGQLTVLVVVPQAPSGPRCGGSALAYNEVLLDAARADLRTARAQLGDAGRGATFDLRVEGLDPTGDELVAPGSFDLVLLPARRRPLRSGRHPAAKRIRAAGLPVRVVGPVATRG